MPATAAGAGPSGNQPLAPLTCGIQVIPETRETKSCWSDAGSLPSPTLSVFFVSRDKGLEGQQNHSQR